MSVWRRGLRLPAALLGLAALAAAAATPEPEFDLITAAGVQQILGAPLAPSTGSLSPRVTIVEYFDYNCGFCKRLTPTLQALLANDSGIALVYKDWPILSAVSVYAARCALAARWQDRYLQAHDALIGAPHLAQNDQVDAILQQVGIDMPRLKADLARHAGSIDELLKRDDEEAQAMGLRGTPGILVGRQLVPGIADLHTLQKLVGNAAVTHEWR
jgi:protein-disulfide isomerase